LFLRVLLRALCAAAAALAEAMNTLCADYDFRFEAARVQRELERDNP
jgi:hypothetical protein